LLFLSKLLKRVVQAHLQAHLDGSSLLPGWQSAYCRLHSTETAVTKVFNDLLMAVDRRQMSALCLLDLPSAFDTVDHDLLLQRLACQFGLCGTVLQWIQSCLSGRTFSVVYGDVLAFIVHVMCSVPQGSVLGPLFFFHPVHDRHGTGSLGYRVNGSFGSSFTSGSPGHHFDPV